MFIWNFSHNDWCYHFPKHLPLILITLCVLSLHQFWIKIYSTHKRRAYVSPLSPGWRQKRHNDLRVTGSHYKQNSITKLWIPRQPINYVETKNLLVPTYLQNQICPNSILRENGRQVLVYLQAWHHISLRKRPTAKTYKNLSLQFPIKKTQQRPKIMQQQRYEVWRTKPNRKLRTKLNDKSA
jgi:hypothetical protein